MKNQVKMNISFLSNSDQFYVYDEKSDSIMIRNFSEYLDLRQFKHFYSILILSEIEHLDYEDRDYATCSSELTEQETKRQLIKIDSTIAILESFLVSLYNDVINIDNMHYFENDFRNVYDISYLINEHCEFSN